MLLFIYDFGGAVHVPGAAHCIDYLLPGIFALDIGFRGSQTGMAIAEDLAIGMVDHFRSLPISISGMARQRPAPHDTRSRDLMSSPARSGTSRHITIGGRGSKSNSAADS